MLFEYPPRGDELRERLAFGILVMIMIFLFAFVFAVLGRGEYEPSTEGSINQPAVSYVLA
jgi:hypothetical protein